MVWHLDVGECHDVTSQSLFYKCFPWKCLRYQSSFFFSLSKVLWELVLLIIICQCRSIIIRFCNNQFPILFINWIIQKINYNHISFKYLFAIICNDMLLCIRHFDLFLIKIHRFLTWIKIRRISEYVSPSKCFAVIEKGNYLLLQGQWIWPVCY